MNQSNVDLGGMCGRGAFFFCLAGKADKMFESSEALLFEFLSDFYLHCYCLTTL